jgi:hypothetical protein
MSIEVKGLRTLDGEDRFYEWAGERYPSVTTVLKYCIPKPGLHKWQAKLAAQTAMDSILHLSTLDEEKGVKFLLSQADTKNTRAELGDEVHAYADAVANGREAPKPSEAALPYIASYEVFQYDLQPEYLATELPVFSREHGYAGTADIYAKIKGKVCVIDIKTGKAIWPEVALQLAAYARAEFGVLEGGEIPTPVCERGYVLHLTDKGYELRRAVIGDESFAAFLAALDMYRWLREDSKYAVGGLIQEGENV